LHDLKGINYLQTGYCGRLPEKIFPIEENLKLKIGAQVMFVKRHINRQRIFNQWEDGIIKSLSSQILVHFPEEDKTIEVEKYRMAKHSIQGRSGD
jgi:hypothetical protein